MRRVVYAFMAAAVALTAVGCVNREQQQQAKRTENLIKDQTRPVTLAPARLDSVSENLEITGEVTTAADVSVGAKMGGRIVAVYVRDGDSVRAGQVIASVESTSLMQAVRQARSGVSAARAQLNQAVTNARVSPSRSTAAVRTAEAAVRAANAQLAKARAGARQEERRQVDAQVRAARSNMDTAKKELDRANDLYAAGAISRQRLDAAQNAYEAALSAYDSALESQRMMQAGARPEDLAMAEEGVRQAEEGLRNARAAQRLDAVLPEQVQAARANLDSAMAMVRIAEQNLSDARITSPFTGRVSGRPVQIGTVVAPGTPVARIIGAEGVYFEGDVPEAQVARINRGMPVEVQVTAIPGRTFSGRIAAINPLGSSVGRVFTVRVQIDSATEGIRPGMFAKGAVALRTISNAVVVPAEALVDYQGGRVVFIVQDGKAKRVPVKVGLTKDGSVQVEGIDAGAQVVIRGQNQIFEGLKVRVEDKKPTAESGTKE